VLSPLSVVLTCAASLFEPPTGLVLAVVVTPLIENSEP
jgi:hypothetical protein